MATVSKSTGVYVVTFDVAESEALDRWVSAGEINLLHRLTAPLREWVAYEFQQRVHARQKAYDAASAPQQATSDAAIGYKS